jgi:hypothetical protein
MSRSERDAAELVETMLRLDDHSPASSLQLSPYARGRANRNSFQNHLLSDHSQGARQTLTAKVQSSSCPTRHSLAGSSVEDWEGEPGTSQMGGLRPGRERDWAAQQSATAPGGTNWGADSLERALELELDIQEADMRAVRLFSTNTLGTYHFAAPILETRHCSGASCLSEGLAQQGITQESSLDGWGSRHEKLAR